MVNIIYSNYAFCIIIIDVISGLSKEHKLLQKFKNEELGKYFDFGVLMEVENGLYQITWSFRIHIAHIIRIVKLMHLQGESLSF